VAGFVVYLVLAPLAPARARVSATGAPATARE